MIQGRIVGRGNKKRHFAQLMLFEAFMAASVLAVALKPSEVRRLSSTTGFHLGRIAGSLAAAQERFAHTAGSSEVRKLQHEIGEASATVRAQFSSVLTNPITGTRSSRVLTHAQPTSSSEYSSPSEDHSRTADSTGSSTKYTTDATMQNTVSKIPVSAHEVGRDWRASVERQNTSALGQMEDKPGGADVLMDALAEAAVAHEASAWLRQQQQAQHHEGLPDAEEQAPADPHAPAASR